MGGIWTGAPTLPAPPPAVITPPARPAAAPLTPRQGSAVASCRAPTQPVAPPPSRAPSFAELDRYADALNRFDVQATQYSSCLDKILTNESFAASERRTALAALNQLADDTERHWALYEAATLRLKEAQLRALQAQPPLVRPQIDERGAPKSPSPSR
jgi:hypothetical protein